MKSLFFALVAMLSLTAATAEASTFNRYRCHSPSNLDAAWSIDLLTSPNEARVQLMDPVINGSSNPRAAAVSLVKAAVLVRNVSNYEGWMNYTGTFSIVLFKSVPKSDIVDGKRLNGFEAEIDGSLATTRFKKVRVTCQIIPVQG